MQPYGTATSLVWHARASDVTDSWVKGKRVLIDGNIEGINKADALEALKSRVNHFGEMIRGLGGRARTSPWNAVFKALNVFPTYADGEFETIQLNVFILIF